MTNFDVLTGKEAENFMKNIIKESEEDDRRRPEKYAKFGYKWNEDTKYKWVESMGEISGFGENYEECCRFTVTKGLEFLDDMRKKYPTEPNPKYHSLENVFGIQCESNKVAKELRDFILWKVEDFFGKEFGLSGAMYHACTNHISWIIHHSWDEYVIKMNEKTKE